MGCEHQAHELEQLRAAALAVVQTGELGVSEEEGIRRLQWLAKLVGFVPGAERPPAGIARDDLRLAAAECGRLFKLIAEEIEVAGGAWHPALFLYTDPPAPGAPGHVICASRDRDEALPPIARWIMSRLDAQKTKARS